MLTSDGKKSVIILPILTLLATVFVALRLARRKQKRALAIDDWLLCFALLMLYVEDVGAFLLAVKGGEGKPIATLSEDELEWLFKMFFWPELGYTILIFTIKLSILLSLKRIFWRIRWFQVAWSFIAFLTVSWFLGVFFSVLFQCTPINKAWIPTKPGHCINLLAFLWGNSISNNIIDWMILALPIGPVLGLQMSRSQKAMVLGSFALGSLACIASLVRAVTTDTIDVTDLSQSVFMASIWTYIEPSLGVISACLPFLSQTIGKKVQIFKDVLRRMYQTKLRGKQPTQSAVQEDSGKDCTKLVDLRGKPLPQATESLKLHGASTTQGTASAQSFV